MPNILVTSPAGAVVHLHAECKRFSDQIRALGSSPLKSGETIDDRMRTIAVLGNALAEAFATLDKIASTFDLTADGCGECEACKAANVSPPTSTGSPNHRGVPLGDDPKTN